MKKKYKSNNLKLALVALLLIVTIGYATLQTNLTINGTSKINNSTWNVHFNNPSAATTGSVAIDTTKYANAKAATKDNATTVSYNVLLSEPGDFYEFTVPVQNEGTIDAMIDEVTSTIQIGTGTVTTINSSADLPAWLDYSVTYSDGVAIAAKQKLDAGDTETYKVRVEFKRNITNEQFAAAVNKELHLTFGVEYVQKDGTAVVVNHTFTGTKYGVYPQAKQLYLNQAVPANAILHLNASDALANWTNPSVMNETSKPYYLKHKIENDVVKESYVVFTVTDEMTQENLGMTAGTYELRGGINESTASEKPYFIQNAKIIYDAFGTNCDSNPYTTTPSSSFDCSGSGFYAYANAYGSVSAYDGFGSYCDVSSDGHSNCN